MPFTIITQDSFVSTGAGKFIPVPQGADYFKTINYTQMNLAGTVCVGGEWYRDVSAQNGGIRWRKAGSNVINMDLFSTATASNGFSYYEAPPLPEAPLTGTTITAANPAVASVTNTYSNGDTVRIYASTGMLQIAGMPFTISSVTGSAFTMLGLNASGFSGGASAFQVRRIDPYYGVSPQFYYITGISKATQGVVTTSQVHDYVVGQLLKLTIPAQFGMVELDQVTVEVVAVSAYSFTISANTSAFTTFAFPASTASPNIAFATVAPVGQRAQYDPINDVTTGYNFTEVPFRNNDFSPVMYLAGGSNSPAGSNGDIIIYQAYHVEN